MARAGRRIRANCLTLGRIGLLALLLPVLLGEAAQGEELKRVLLLHGYNFSHPASMAVGEAARKRLTEASPHRLILNAEFLDLVRPHDPDHARRMAHFVRDKYASDPPEVIMSIGGETLPFVMQHRDVIGPDIPVVFTSVGRTTYESLKNPKGVTGIILDLDLEHTVSLAERLQPNAKSLYFIAGSGNLDRRWQARARRFAESHLARFNVTYLFDLTYEDLFARLSQVPPDGIVVLLTFYVDGAGRAVETEDVATALARQSPAPFYSPYSIHMGKGMLGGYSETFESHGIAAADLVLKILAGTDPAALPPHSNPDKAYRVDYRALQRWELNERNLPSGTVITFKNPAIWDQHRGLVIAALSIITVLAALVAALLVQRRRRHSAEVLLKESEERMTFTAAAMNVGLWQFDRQTNELWATEHCWSLFALPRTTPLTRETFLAAIHPDDRARAISALSIASDTDRPSMSDVRVLLPSGKTHWVRIRARSHPTDRSTLRQLSGLFVDVTEQKAAEAEANLQRQEVAHLMRVSVLGELSGAIAHEINQPLTAVQSNAETGLSLLAMQSPDLIELRDVLEEIVHDNRRASDVIQRLRGLLRKGERKIETVRMNDLVRSTAGLLNSEAITRGITVKLELDGQLLPVSGDPVQLQQVLLNLMLNAMDAMAAIPAAGRILEVSTRTDAETIEILVEDQGSGIVEEQQDKLFQPFHTTKAHGIGLGLSICSTIVQAHGGTLSLANRDRTGAVAAVVLPTQCALVAAA